MTEPKQQSLPGVIAAGSPVVAAKTSVAALNSDQRAMLKLGLVSTYIRAAPRLAVTQPVRLGAYTFRMYTEAEATTLASYLSRRNAFARVRRDDFYPSRARALADASVLHTDARNWGGGWLPPEQAREEAERVERLLFLSAAYPTERIRLHARLGVDPSRAGGIDLHMDGILSHVSTRTRLPRVGSPLIVDPPTVRRIRNLGIESTAPAIIENATATMKRVNRALSWLEESRIEPHAQAATIKTAIGFETLLVFDSSEPLRKVIAERLAFLLGRNPAQRAVLSSTFARFYDARSAIAHGGHRKVELGPALRCRDRVLLLAAVAMASHAAAHADDGGVRAWFEALRWGAEPVPRVPFGRGVLDRALALRDPGKKRAK
jgi:hypothetical protein